jgi:hypothetical protein
MPTDKWWFYLFLVIAMTILFTAIIAEQYIDKCI